MELIRRPVRRYFGVLAASSALLASAVACGERAEPAPVEELTPAQILERASERMAELSGFAFVLEHENGFTRIVQGLAMERAEGRVAGGDRMEAHLRARAGPVNVQLGIIILPEDSWITNPFTGEWEREPLSISQLFDPATGVPSLIRELQDPQMTGIETVGGAQAYRVEASIPSDLLSRLAPAATPGRVIQVRAWVGVQDPVVHRVEIIGPLEEGDGEDVVRRLALSDFDADFSIVAPN